MSTQKFTLGQNNKSKSNRRALLIISCVALVIIAGIGTFVITSRRNSAENTRRDDAQTSSSKNNEISSSEKESGKQSTSQNLPKDSSVKTAEEIPTSSELKVAIDSAKQEGSSVGVKSAITGSNKQGTCVFLFTNPEDRPVTRELISSGSGNKQDCSTSVPSSMFNRLGAWTIKVTYYVDNNKAEAQSEINIK